MPRQRERRLWDGAPRLCGSDVGNRHREADDKRRAGRSAHWEATRMALIDVEKLRRYLMDYFGTAMVGGFPLAVADLSDVEMMSPEELVELAQRMGIDLRRFAVG